MRKGLIVEELSLELIDIKSSKNIVADALSCLDKTDNENHKIEPSLDSLSENFALNREDVLHPTGFETMMRIQLLDKPLIEIVKEKP